MGSPFIWRFISLVYLATTKGTSVTPDSLPAVSAAAFNIKQFVETSDPIWTYNSTENTTILCKVGQKREITENTYSFNRSYYRGYSNWTTLDGEGTFDSTDKAKLNVVLQEYNYTETLLYTDNYNSCAIVQVTPMNAEAEPWYEHLVKNSSITKRKNKNCTDFFKNTAKAGRKVYRSRCLHMLSIGNATFSRWELH
uniref:Lipocalin n=1 Tax=Rhipicephalus zambeziensis TaxID=60191 RepID=A0A224YC72_9ACAR